MKVSRTIWYRILAILEKHSSPHETWKNKIKERWNKLVRRHNSDTPPTETANNKSDESPMNGLQKEFNEPGTNPPENDELKSTESNENSINNDNTHKTDTSEQTTNKQTSDLESSNKSKLDNAPKNQSDPEEPDEKEGTTDDFETVDGEESTLKDQQPSPSESNSNTNSTLEKSNSKKTQPSPDQGAYESNRKKGTLKSTDSKNKNKSNKPKRKKEREPWDIGGRRISRGPRGNTFEPGDYERTPKLICRENRSSSIFDVILILPDKYPVNSVLLNDKELSMGNQPGEYPLHSYSGKLVIDPTDGEKIVLKLPEESPLIFKLRKKWRGDGNSHRYLTRGYFVVIAPKRWIRQGNVPVEETPCSDSNFQAHFFHVDETNAVLEETGFKEYSIPLNKHCLNLEGKVLPDKSGDGKLFVQNLPILTPDSNVKWVRVGYEGINGWGENFKPDKKQVGDVLPDKCGHFFIRVYDEEVRLLDSDQFRFSSALKHILVDGEPYEDDDKIIPPPKGGHKSTTLQFVGTNDKNIAPLNKDIDGTIKNDMVFLYPVPGNDTTEWKIPSGSGQDHVSVVIELQRIWWQKKLPEDKLGEWLDKPIELTREEFCKLAKKKATLEFLPKHSKESLKIGFDDKLDIKRNIKDKIALSDFLYHKPIVESSSEESILKIRIDDSEIDLIVVMADQNSNSIIDYPKVCGGGVRYRRGKGFSRSEIARAGISIEDLKRLSIPFDKRRRSSQKINTKQLKKVKTDA